MINFFDTSALMCYPNEINEDIFISEISLQELEKISVSNEYDATRRETARLVLSRIRSVGPTVVLLEDAIHWYQEGTHYSYYSLSRLSNRDFLSTILCAFYIFSVCDEDFTFHTESYLSYANSTSLYFDIPTKISNIKNAENH